MVYIWFKEWNRLELLETENRKIDLQRQDIHAIYADNGTLSYGRNCIGMGG